MNIDAITPIIEQLRFLRPDWFYAFIALLIFIVLMLRRHKSSIRWKAVVDAQLLPYMLTGSSSKSSRFPLLLTFIAISLGIVAAAGPVVEKLPQPVFREQSALVIALDLSQSMDASDLKPSRLQRARLKLLDMLKARKGGQTALIVYAADAFVVTPLTDDTNTIANLVPSLETSIMPSQGSHAYRAIEKSLELFKQSGVTRGDVLLITDGISDRDITGIESLKAQGHRLSILGIGTAEGSPIPTEHGFLQDASGAIVVPKLQITALQRAAQSGGGLYLNMQADDSDINRFSELFTKNKIRASLDENKLGETDLRADIWQEEGPWLLLLVIPLAALGLRKGWLLCLPLLLMPVADPAYALDLDHLWSKPDQKAMRAFKQGDAATAAEQFEQPDWKASAYYRAGNYEESLRLLDNPASSDDFYNRGNALAKLQRYQEAIQAYDEALKLNQHNDDAQYNREQVKKALPQQQNESQQEGEDQKDNDSKNKDQQNSSDKSEAEQNNKEQQQGESEQQQSQQDGAESSPEKNTEQSESEKDKEKQDQAKVEQAMKDAAEKEQQENEQQKKQEESEQQGEQDSLSLSNTEEINEDDQATEQWLKRIPDDPGLLLRRKFHYQYKQLPEQTPSNEQW